VDARGRQYFLKMRAQPRSPLGSRRQEGRRVNHKRVDRLYAEARLQVKRRRRKKVPLADRQPLARPLAPNAVWSADFIFDRTAEGRVLKCLTIVDDATTGRSP
jgi:transposase InsO family protein